MLRSRCPRFARLVLAGSTVAALTSASWAQSPFGLQPLLSGAQCEWLDVADFNGDGRPDLAATQVHEPVCVFLASGRGTFHPPILLAGAFAQTPHDMVISDVDDDGDLDIVTS